MKILIISSGFFPVTNHMGGAIENLIETYLKENDEKFKNDITLYSVKTN
ncbi:MAG: glycosyltransferase family 1 protein, partial [Clostridia bacterium]|nr:glycosyltransferase family 1 protein [Clostridia bacterium]